MKQNYESGRSMVEMLGTLAIIGVLSIGGIAGYSYGMDKYRANETINDVNMRGIDLVRQAAMGQTLSLSEWPTVSKAGYDISEPVLSAEGDAYFTISGVPKRVCEMVYEGIMQNQTTDVEVNGYVVDDSSACGDDNTMGFFFITNAGEGGTNPEELCKDVTCPEGSSCTHGICMSEEIPQLHSDFVKYCSQTSECSECEYCDNMCKPKDNGTTCIGGTCYDGKCVLNDDVCMSHDDCETGYFCDIGEWKALNKCVKLEFYKTSLQGVYLSKMATKVGGLCELAGFYQPTKEQMVDIVKKLGDSIISGSVYLDTADYGPCQRDEYCPGDHLGRHALCFDDTAEWEMQTVLMTEAAETTTPESETTTSEETTTVSGCTSNEECDSDEYCAPTAPTCTEGFPSGAPGTCKTLDFNEYEIIVNGVNETWYASHFDYYWEAKQACDKIGANMVDIDDLMNNVNSTSPYGSGQPNKRAVALYSAIGIGDLKIMTKRLDGCSPLTLVVSDWFVSSGYMDNIYNLSTKALCYKGTLNNVDNAY